MTRRAEDMHAVHDVVESLCEMTNGDRLFLMNSIPKERSASFLMKC